MCTEERKPHKHAALIKAWADGATIQFKSVLGGCWIDVVNNRPAWHEHSEYRVKPEQIKSIGYRRYLCGNQDKGFFIGVVYEDGGVITPYWVYKWIDTEWQYETVEVK